MNETEAFKKLQELFALADSIVSEHYSAADIVNELMNHFDIDEGEL